ncbi:hypothetical protein DICVIV_03364 [Dictyocaulus viviparus]|uniref:Uncharacterized protein n=1 Tax=Dictyocaulus viviparus TaxID=29172 RepID=A0A0D8Y3B1_DICVI|nr:hypothetical protein DICVIV_03364 [Dictyocaulus viviparus]
MINNRQFKKTKSAVLSFTPKLAPNNESHNRRLERGKKSDRWGQSLNKTCYMVKLETRQTDRAAAETHRDEFIEIALVTRFKWG